MRAPTPGWRRSSDLFEKVDALEYGTTNIDFSTKLQRRAAANALLPGDALRHRSRRADGGHGRGGDAREEDRPAGKAG